MFYELSFWDNVRDDEFELMSNHMAVMIGKDNKYDITKECMSNAMYKFITVPGNAFYVKGSNIISLISI